MNLKKSLLPLALCALPVFVNADVTIQFATDSLRTALGDLAPTNTLALLIADPGGNGFGNLGPGSINQYDVVGSGDIVVARFDFSGAGTPGIIYNITAPVSLTGFSPEDQLAIVWLPGLTTASDSVSASQSYGLLTDSTWLVPPDGNQNASFYQVISATSQGALVPNATTLNVTNFESQANLQVVPEPRTYALVAGLLTLGLVAMHRRKQGR